MKIKRLKRNYNRLIYFCSVCLVLVIIIGLGTFSYAYYCKKESYNMISSKIKDFRGEIININYYINDDLVDYIPDKDLYNNNFVSCDNADIIWNKKDWKYEISNPLQRTVNCDIKFIEKETIYAHVALNSLGLDTDVGLNYDAISSETNGLGIYSTKETDSGKEVFFYRGDVKDNNVIFGGFCWLIVRTTETNGVKLIYNGVSIDGKCETRLGSSTTIGTSKYNSSNGYNASLGYMYGDINGTTYKDTHSNINDSIIKLYIDNWYENNLILYFDRIEDTVYCNDREVMTYDASKVNGFSSYKYEGYARVNTFYGAAYRAWSNSKQTNPTLKCAQMNDRFTISASIGNGSLKYPIATITADELIYAGLTAGSYAKTADQYKNLNFYLYDNCTYWTMTPIGNRSDYTGVSRMRLDGYTDYNSVNMNYAVRPVISLKGSVLIDDGDGTVENPFIIK